MYKFDGHPIVAGWWWLYTFFKENVRKNSGLVAQSNFLSILYTVAGSRNQMDWVVPHYLPKTNQIYESLLKRARNLNAALEFMNQKGILNSDIDLSRTRTCERLAGEFQDILNTIERKFHRELKFNVIDVPDLEGKKIDEAQPYRSYLGDGRPAPK